MGINDIENERELYFPLNVKFDDILLFLETVYPPLEFEIIESTDRSYIKLKNSFVRKETESKPALLMQIVIEFTTKIDSPVFEIIKEKDEEQEFYVLKDIRSRNENNDDVIIDESKDLFSIIIENTDY